MTAPGVTAHFAAGWQRHRRELGAGGSLAIDVAAGMVVAFLTATFSLSYAALLFAGTDGATQARGLVMLLTGSVVLTVVGALLSSLPFSILFADSTIIAMLAAVTAGIVTAMRGAPPAAIAATLIATLVAASIVTGVALWLIGFARGGGIVRYVPFQVMAGLRAASGWSLSLGGIVVATRHPVSLTLFADLSSLEKLVPALLVAAAMLLATARYKGPVTLSIVIAAAIALHHLVFASLGWTLAEQQNAGWLLAIPPTLPPVLPWSPEIVAAIDWPVLGDNAQGLAALIPVAAILLLLNISSIEAGTGADIDVNRDLKANGVAAFLCGALGGVFGITSASRTSLLYRMGAHGRRASIIAGLAGGLVPLLWPGLLDGLPRSMLGGLLLFTGIGTLQQWVLKSRTRLSWPEWLTVLAVLAIGARFGLIAGVFAGLLLGCITFAVIYSQGSPIRARYRGDGARSRVDRQKPEQALLDELADTVVVLHLQGFLFFGTANRLVDEIRRDIAVAPGRLRHLVLDFGNVDGIDGSALSSFERLHRIAAAERIVLVLTTMAETIATRLAELPPVAGSVFLVAATLDAGLEAREEALLVGLAHIVPPPLATQLMTEFADPAEAQRFIDLLEGEDVPAGAILMRQGDLSDDLVFIERGRASATIRFNDSASLRVRSFGAGTMVGEIGFCLGLPRTATVQADEPCRVMRFTRAAMQRLEADQPAAALAFQRLIMRRLGNRLLEKDQLISAFVLDAVHPTTVGKRRQPLWRRHAGAVPR